MAHSVSPINGLEGLTKLGLAHRFRVNRFSAETFVPGSSSGLLRRRRLTPQPRVAQRTLGRPVKGIVYAEGVIQMGSRPGLRPACETLHTGFSAMWRRPLAPDQDLLSRARACWPDGAPLCITPSA